jgi:hypothetical protein
MRTRKYRVVTKLESINNRLIRLVLPLDGRREPVRVDPDDNTTHAVPPRQNPYI